MQGWSKAASTLSADSCPHCPSSSHRTLPFTQILLCFPERQGLPYPSGPVLWCGHTMKLRCTCHSDLPDSSWRAGAMPHMGLRVLGMGLLTLSRRFRALSCNTGCRVGLRGRLCSSGSGTGSSRKDTEAVKSFPFMPHSHLLLNFPKSPTFPGPSLGHQDP